MLMFNKQIESIKKLLQRDNLTENDKSFINKVLSILSYDVNENIKKVDIQNIIYYISYSKLGMDKKYWNETLCTLDKQTDQYTPNSDLIVRILHVMKNPEVTTELSNLVPRDYEIKRCNKSIDYYSLVLQTLKDLYQHNQLLSLYNAQSNHYLDLKEEKENAISQNRKLRRRRKSLESSFVSKIKNRRYIKHIKGKIAENEETIAENSSSLNRLYIDIQHILSQIDNQNLRSAFYLNLKVSRENGRLNIDENPFTSQDLDITFDWVLSSHRISDLNYFLGINLQSISTENLLSAINKLERIIEDNQIVLQSILLDYGNLVDNMTPETQSIINSDYETAISFGQLNTSGLCSDITVSIWLEVLDILGQIDKTLKQNQKPNSKDEKNPVLQIKPNRE